MKTPAKKEQVLALLSSGIPMSYGDICAELKASKREKVEIKNLLQELVETTTIVKHGKMYRLKIQQKKVVQKSSTLIEGVFDATPLSRNYSYAFVKTEVGDYFVSSEDVSNAYHGDKVLIEGSERGKNRLYGVVRDIVSRANETLAGDVKKVDTNYYFICSNPKIHNWFNISKPKPEYDGKKVILAVSNWGNKRMGKAPAGKVTEILGESGNPEVEVLGVIRQYNLPLEFPQPVMDEVNRVKDTITKKEISKRRDLRDLFTFTIDPASAKDFDDAISIAKVKGGYELYVHIADVAHYVKLDSAIFIEAVNRGNSYYFPKKVIPMLPEKLSNKVCSLRPEEEKLTMTVYTLFDDKGNLKKQELFESVINSNFRLAYEDVDNLFSGKETDLAPELIEALQVSRTLSRLLSKVRKKAGYIFFDLPDIDYIYDKEGFIKTFTLSEETESHKLIENFMLVANEYVAKKLTNISPTTMYRIHEDPDFNKIEKLATTLSYYGIKFTLLENLNKSYQALLDSMPTQEHHIVFDRMVLRSMKKAKYSTEHIRHFGLSIESYTHFTSPIRRLCDLIIHHLCKYYITHSSDSSLSKVQVKHYAAVASEKELVADETEREIERVYNRAYMKKKIGEQYSGLIIGVKSTGVIVRLNEIPITGIININASRGSRWDFKEQELRLVNRNSGYFYQLMDKVLVQVMDVSDDIYLELTPAPDAHTHSIQAKSTPSNAKARDRKDRSYKGSKRSKRKK